MELREWLDNLKTGDRVAVEHYSHVQLQTVQRTTATQIILKDGGRYRRIDGHPPGQSYTAPHIAPPTPERVEKARRQRMLNKVKHANWLLVPDKKLERIIAILEE
jgi:hypothetical protein